MAPSATSSLWCVLSSVLGPELLSCYHILFTALHACRDPRTCSICHSPELSVFQCPLCAVTTPRCPFPVHERHLLPEVTSSPPSRLTPIALRFLRGVWITPQDSHGLAASHLTSLCAPWGGEVRSPSPWFVCPVSGKSVEGVAFALQVSSRMCRFLSLRCVVTAPPSL